MSIDRPKTSANVSTMNCEQLNVAFAGTPQFAAVALNALLASSHTVSGVLTQPDRPAGRGRKLTMSAVKQLALNAGVPVQQPQSLKDTDAVAQFREWDADVLVVAAYGLLLPQTVLDIPALGCLNIHASLLPRWRGAAPIHRAILANDQQTGVCIMQMDAGLDTGDVLLEKRCAIGPDETSAQLHDRLASLGAQALLESLAPLCRGELQATAQPLEGVSYAQKLSKQEARLDFTLDAQTLHRQVRAFNPWPVAEANLQGQRVRLWQSRMVDEPPLDLDASAGTIVAISEEAVRVKTGDSDLEFVSLQWPGKRPQSAADFARGRELTGQVFNSKSA